MIQAAEAAQRFAADLDALVQPGTSVGIAVSGGPDSLALLLLAAAARPGRVQAATVDHGLRSASGSEAQMVAAICDRLSVPHSILKADWADAPHANVQAEARAMRYRILGSWAKDRELESIATGHHADDQVETVMMRLARGAGVAGLGGIRPKRELREGIALVRPLLDWRKAELQSLVAEAGLAAVDDPSNRNPSFDRSRIRQALKDASWVDAARLARSAAALRDADEALDWTVASLLPVRLRKEGEFMLIEVDGLPREIRRRLLIEAIHLSGGSTPRGPDVVRAIAEMESGRTATLGALKLEGGEIWRLSPAPPRRG
jgi:tRNA(Ile)-lysidine synthase